MEANDRIRRRKREQIEVSAAEAVSKLEDTTYMRKSGFYLNLGLTEQGRDLATNLAEYIRLTGWTQTRFFLLGAAKIIQENGDNPNLIVQIAEYVASIRAGRPRIKPQIAVDNSDLMTATDSESNSANPSNNSNPA